MAETLIEEVRRATGLAPRQAPTARSPELTVDGEVEHGELSDALAELKANGPDILEAQRRLLTNELALVPRFALGRGSNRLVHGGGTL